MNPPTVSVIILTYNRAELVCKTIRSVLKQTFQDFEIVVIDDGSDDDTADAIAKLNASKIIFEAYSHSGHIAKLRNAGIAKSRGKYLTFLDSDDLWKESHLQSQVNVLNSTITAGYVFSDVEVFNQERIILSNIYQEKRGRLFDRNLFNEFISGDLLLLPATNLMFRRNCLETAGTFNEQFRGGDYDFLSRLVLHYHGALSDGPPAQIRRHEGEQSSATLEIENLREVLFCIRRFRKEGNLEKAAYKRLALQYHYKIALAFRKQKKHFRALREYVICFAIKPNMGGIVKRIWKNLV